MKKDWGKWKNWRDSFFSSVSDDELGQCKVCGRPAGAHCKPLHDRPDLRCDVCWEVETRLADYLKDGGKAAKRFVVDILGKACSANLKELLKSTIE